MGLEKFDGSPAKICLPLRRWPCAAFVQNKNTMKKTKEDNGRMGSIETPYKGMTKFLDIPLLTTDY
jgi:hypothetical protein